MAFHAAVDQARAPLRPLLTALAFDPKAFWFGEYVAVIVGAGGGAWLAVAKAAAAPAAIAVAAGLVGVVIGAVVAGMAIQTASFSTTFVRNLDATKLPKEQKDLVRYLSPFLFTAATGICAGLSLMVWVAVPPTAPSPWRGLCGAASGLLSFETFASLIPALSTLIQFVQLLQASARAADHTDAG